MKRSKISGADCLRIATGRVGYASGRCVRQIGVSEATYLTWKKKFGGGSVTWT